MSKITVIIPVEKKNKDITKCLYSLLNQNFSEYTAYVVSNGEILNKVYDSKIHYIELKNKKYSVPRLIEKGIDYVNTDLVTFIHPDDLLLFYALESRYNEFLFNPEIAAAYGLGIDTDINYSIKSENSQFFKNNTGFLIENSINSVIKGDIMPTISSLMIKTDILKSLMFDLNLEFCYSWDFYIKLFSLYSDRVIQILDPIYISRYEEEVVKARKSKYFRGYITETQTILSTYSDTFLAFTDIIDKVDIYKSFYYRYLGLLSGYYSDNPVMKLFLLATYLKTNIKLDNTLFEYWYFSTLLNSIIYPGYVKPSQVSDI